MQRAEGRRQKAMRHAAWLGTLILCNLPLVTCAQDTNDIPPLRPPHAEIPPTFWEDHTTGIIVIGTTALALAGFAAWLALRPKPPVVVPPEVQARGELESLRKLPEDGRVLSKISQAVRRYFGAAFALPPGELTTAEFCRTIAADDRIGPDLSASANDFLRRCDERKFAPDPPDQMMGAARQALKLVEQAEMRRAELQQAAQAKPEPARKT